ncbi:hypothetical protein HOY80DRAFT_1087858 [Tuber brumale]|nr:hypothetical protein HOY80DRAFT_1087858 [Tuber brumale]
MADNGILVSEPNPFNSSDPDSYHQPSTGSYSSPLGLTLLSGLLRYSKASRDSYIRTSLTQAAALLGLQLTLVEREGLAYYNSRSYSHESYVGVLGVSSWVLIAFLHRSRKPSIISTAMVSLPKEPGAQRVNAAGWLSRGLRLAVPGTIGWMYGLTSAGSQALEKDKAENRADQNLRRAVAEILVKGPGMRRMEGFENLEAQDDELGLGRRTSLYERPLEQVAELEARKRRSEMNTRDTNEPKVGGCPNRAPMKGYGEGANREPGTDSFKFSKSEEERQSAKQEAQKEFDRKVEKERRGELGDGLVERDSMNWRWGT